MLDVVVLDPDQHVVPLAGRAHGFRVGGNQVVERAGPVGLQLAVGVALVVEHLHFNTGAPGGIFRFILHQVENAAVAARGNLPLQAEFEIPEFLAVIDQVATGPAKR